MSHPEQSLYRLWLSSTVNLADKKTAEMLDFMSSFDKLEYKNAGLTLRYARSWCILSRFLYQHREQQLYSDKVQMLFRVDERQQLTDVYWFEVARSCDLYSNEVLLNLLQDMGVIRCLAEERGYAEVATQLDNSALAAALLNIKSAIGICHYTLTVAALHCKLLQPSAPKLLAGITLRYNTFRVMGCFIQGLHQIRLQNAEEAAKWLCTAEHIGKQHSDVAPAVAPLLHSTHMLKLHAFAHKALLDGQRGIALGFSRDASAAAGKGPHASFAKSLQNATALPFNAIAPAIPPAGSALLSIASAVQEKALEVGTSPFGKEDPMLQRAQ